MIIFSREGRPENLGNISNNRDIYCYAKRGVVNFEREYQPPSHGTKILVMPQFSYMPDQILGKKRENSIFRPKFDLSLGSSPSQNIRMYSKIFYMTKRLWL